MRPSNSLVVRAALTSAIALAAAAFSGPARAILDCELNGESVSPNNGSTTAGKTGLMRCKDRDTGAVQREQEIRNGVFMGAERHYVKGRLVREQSKNERGNLQGLSREFSPSGQVIREAHYDNGTEVGLTRTYYPSGRLQRATWYARGEKAHADFTEAGQLYDLGCGDQPYLAPAVDDARLCGYTGGPSQLEFFSAKGVVTSRASYAAGKRLRYEELHDNGRAALQVEVDGNLRIERRYSEAGVMRRERIVTRGEHAVRQSEKEFAESGTLAREQRWNGSGDPLLDQIFYLNGQPRHKTEYSGTGAAQVAEETWYSDSGQRVRYGRFAPAGDGRRTPIGVHQRYDEQGRLVGESTYDDKGRLTRERAWDAGGKLERDDAVFEDGSRKAYAK